MPRNNSGRTAIIKAVEKAKKEVGEIVRKRLKEFESFGSKSSKEWFKELCFCILTANFSAEGGIKIQEEIGDGFLTLNEKTLAKKLRALGHRFPNTRARYIIEARKYAEILKEVIGKLSEEEARDWLVKNIKGIGMKEASHFLRNVGYKNLAILDYHVLDILEKYGVVKRPKTLTKKKYLEIEEEVKNLAKELGITLAELDLYLWYLETGKVLK